MSEKGPQTFLDRLKEDPVLYAQLERIKQKGLEDWVSLLMPDIGSHAGYPHLLNVERIANRIIPDHLKLGFSVGEVFLLLSAIFFHDIGRTVPAKAGTHHDQSEQIIREHGVALGLPDERIAEYCGLLAYCHGLSDPQKASERSSFRITSLAPYGVLRIPLLAAILRIADETDNLWTRAMRNYWVHRYGSSEQIGKAFRRYIEDIEFCHEGECLIVHVAEPLGEGNKQTKLDPKDVRSINIAARSMAEVATAATEDSPAAAAPRRWGNILKDSTGVHFRKVYIEFGDRLYEAIEAAPKLVPLGTILDPDGKSALPVLLDAATSLFLSSYGHRTFTWQALEAKVGRPLTSRDKWLILRMGRATPEFWITSDSQGEEFSIMLRERSKDKMDEISRLVLGGGHDTQ